MTSLSLFLSEGCSAGIILCRTHRKDTISSKNTRDLNAIKGGNFARYSEESMSRRKTEICRRSLADQGKPGEIRKVLPLEGNVKQHSRVETQSNHVQTKRLKGKSESETSHNPGHRAPQHDHTVIRTDEMLSNDREEAPKKVKEYTKCESTFNDNNLKGEQMAGKNIQMQEPNSQKAVSGAKYQTVMNGGVKVMKTKIFSKTESIDNRKDKGTKIPVSQNSKPFIPSEENDSFNAKRTSSPCSSETGNSIASTKDSEKTGNKLSDEFNSSKLSLSHSIKKKPSNKSVTGHSTETGSTQVLAAVAGESNAESMVKPGIAGSSQVLAASAARKVRQRKGSQEETDTENVDRCFYIDTRAVQENNHNVSVSNKNGALVNEINVLVSESRQTSTESKTGLYSKEDSQERPRSNIRNKRKLSQLKNPRKIIVTNVKRRSSESSTGSSDEQKRLQLSIYAVDDVLPWYPEPTPGIKPIALDAIDFTTMGQRVLQASSEAGSFKSLLKFLCGNLESDVARVRAIYCWIVNQRLPIIDDVTDVAAPETPFGYLYLIMHRRRSYAELFCKMCRYTDIPCVVIHGITKGITYDVGDVLDNEKHRNSWNAVYVEENWRFVHCHWASRAARGYCSGQWATVDCPEFHIDDTGGESRSYIISTLINDMYFFTEPSIFINKCFPFDSRWQLLPKEITKVEFESRPFLQPAFYSMKLKLVDESIPCVLNVHGKFVLEIKMPLKEESSLRFSYNLYRLRNSADEGEYDYPTLERYTLHYCLNDIAFFEVRFPPTSVGEYKLQIHCSDQQIRLPSEWVCDFKIVCERGMDHSLPLPVVPRIGWGMNPELAKHCITAVSHKGGFYSLDDDQMTFVFVFPKESDVRAELIKSGRSKKDFVENVKVKKLGVDVQILVEPPCQGEFALLIFFQMQGAQNFVNVCNYLLEMTCFAETKAQNEFRKNISSAISRRDVTVRELTEAIENYVRSGAKDSGELEAAKNKLNRLKLREELLEAIACRSIEKLEKALKGVSDAKMDKDMGGNVVKGEKLLSHLRKLKRFRSAVLEMDSKTISELRSYHKPPIPVHGVMMATYVLLGVDEKEIKHWFGVQNLIGKTGREALKKRVENFDVKAVRLESLHRTKEILKNYDLSIVQDASAGAATFYQWAINMIKDIEEQKHNEPAS